MTVPEVRSARSAPPIPRPRTGEPRTVDRDPAAVPVLQDATPPEPAARYPWPEPWGSFRGARPRTEYWDVDTASWHSRGPLRRPGD